jgi:hypothetical protein
MSTGTELRRRIDISRTSRSRASRLRFQKISYVIGTKGRHYDTYQFKHEVYIPLHMLPNVGSPKLAQVCQSSVQLARLLQHAKKFFASPSTVQLNPDAQVRGESNCSQVSMTARLHI